MKNSFSVLVIEDSLNSRNTTALLRDAGCYVLTAESCTAALDKMPEYLDAVVIDSETPGLCTRNSLAQLKARAPRTATVVLAGKNQMNVKQADGILPLQFKAAELIKTLRESFLKSPKGTVAAQRAALLAA